MTIKIISRRSNFMKMAREMGFKILMLPLAYIVAAIVFAPAYATVLGISHLIETYALKKPVCIESKRVAEVGGCDIFGKCKIRYEDGSVGQASKPVSGETICLTWERQSKSKRQTSARQ